MRSLKRILVLKVDPERPDKFIIELSARLMREGALVAFPTETVYGLGANLFAKDAVARLYNVKSRPKGKPFTVLIANLGRVKDMGCKITKEAGILIGRFWPGPITLILKSKNGKKIGFRMPANKIALELLKSAKVPVAAPSANISGRRPPTNAKEVSRQLAGKIDILLDGGKTEVGVESTVIDMTVTPPKILREGAIKRERIFEAIK